jgi:hypothetical protein
MATIDRTATSEGSSENLKHVLDTARAALDHEFQRAERLDAKARNQTTLAGSWLIVAQAVAAFAIRSNVDIRWVIAVGVLFILEAVAFVWLLKISSGVWALKVRPDISGRTLEAMEDDVANPDFASRTIETYRGILVKAQEANEDRAQALEWTWRPWWVVLVLGFLEMGVALLARIL